MSAPKIDPYKINLMKVRVVKASFTTNLVSPLTSPVPNFKVGFKSQAGFNIEESYHIFHLFIKIHAFNGQDQKLDMEGEYQIDFHFIIDNLKDFISYPEDGGDFKVSKLLGATIAGISYSTSRGIILERTLNTELSGVLLPVIDPNNLLEQDSFSQM